MADTLLCYNEKELCEDCGKPPVTVKHWGAITNNEMKSLCSPCWKKRLEKENKKK